MRFSLQERKRRYALVRKEMEDENLSALLIVSNAQINLQGFVRYFTNLPIPIYSYGLLFPLSGEPFLFTPSPLQTFWAKELSWVPRENIFMSKRFGEEFANRLIELNIHDEKIGLISHQTLSAQDFLDLKRLCPKVTVAESTHLLERIRSSKSEEEIQFSKKATDIAEIAHQAFSEYMKPGISEAELVAKVEEIIRRHNGERSFYLVSSNVSNPFPYLPGEQVITDASPLLFSIEVAGPGGYWSQIVRTYFWEKPQGVLQELYELALDLRLLAQREMRPGRHVKDVAQTLRDEIYKNGFEYGIHFGHGLGLDVVEEPLINTESDILLQKNQFVTVHPHLINRRESKGVWLGDMYFVGEDKTEILSSLKSSVRM